MVYNYIKLSKVSTLLNQNIKEILKCFGMANSRPIRTPMALGHKLSKNDDSIDVNTKEKKTDIFTKALPKDDHEYLRGKLGVIPLAKEIESEMVLCIKWVEQNILQVDAKIHASRVS